MARGIGFRLVFHRTQQEKDSHPTDKERFIKRQPRELVRLDAHTPKPRVEIRRITPYTALNSFAKVDSALAAIAPVSTHAQVMAQVQGHIRTHLMLNPKRPLVVLLGEHHYHYAAQSVAMTALHSLQGAATRQAMVEQPPEDMERTGPDPAVASQAADLRRRMQRGTVFDTGQPRAEEDIMVNNWVYASMLGYPLKGYDAFKDTSESADQREAGILGCIANQLPAADVTVVMVGSNHLPYLHEKLSPLVNTLAIAMVDSPKPGDTEDMKRLSYMLDTPQILKIRPSADPKAEINSGRLDPSAFARQLDGSAPAAQASTSRAST